MAEVNSEIERKMGNEIGNVLWFDQKKGIGFIKIITPDSVYVDKEIFIHYSNINSLNNYKKLFPGENVSLDVKENPEKVKGKEYYCENVSGLFNAPLLVDNTKHIYRVIRKRDDFMDDRVEGEGGYDGR